MKLLKVVHCKRCGANIKVPVLTIKQKIQLRRLKNGGKTLNAVDQVRHFVGYDLKEAKALALHINDQGHCNRCDFDDLQGENVICPKCQAFNLNWESN